MIEALSSCTSTVERHAKSLLHAWNAGDASALDREVENALRFDMPGVIGLDEERVELLQGIAGQMRDFANEPLENARQLKFRVCAGLLQHLVRSSRTLGVPFRSEIPVL